MASNKSFPRKLIVSCAITGSIHTPTMSDALPYTPADIAAQAIGAAEAGAAIVHLHARDPNNGRPSGDPALFNQFLPRIKQATDAVVNISTGGRFHDDDRGADRAAAACSPEMCSLNMGSMNFALHPMAEQIQELEVRLGRTLSAQFRRKHFPQYVSRHQADRANAGRRPRREIRARML